ncbi:MULTISPECIES: LysE family translocator [unclassified Polaribacter]|jgi:threonine/homoserine/homoserine lactone efflux protein|uniref:LysE family translocator n=1 Tax=unclassified Polaribacter TaxID=196858 RepID=UPI00052D90B8|nr:MULTISPECIES: LysE family transporter [unclassified Polaribacter]KGL59299.1 lysine transporter LysE [Polaribacter sp. Hel1_33_49]MBT4413049.1 LysE family transporter [Polaribacter sp.]MBT7816497.1 LysE family transporter [Polaribacter sp.]PKV63781.1 threonine/homoserine/homoserine lactone efflux protein [Polaribacter sp. Hel1_33_96]
MDIYDFKNALIIGFFMAFMIGPVFFMLIQTSILKGARAAIVFDLGVIIGDLTFILIAYYGSRPLLEKIKDDPRLFFIGGLVLVIYGLITYFNKENKKEALESAKIIEVPIKNNYLKLFLKGYFLNFINIGVLAFWLGTVLVIGPALKMDQTAIFWYFGTILISYFVTDLGKIVLAKKLKNKMTPRVIYRVKKIMGIILIICGVFLMLKGFIPSEKIDKLIQ